MGVLDFFRTEKRTIVYPNGSVPISADNFPEIFSQMFAGGVSASGVSVNVENALGVPAVWSAVNFISGTIAGLPLNVYTRRGESRSKAKNNIQKIVHDAVNDHQSSFEWRKFSFEQVLTGGRSFTYIERNDGGQVVNLFPLDPICVTIRREGLNKVYVYKEGNNAAIQYQASEVIDLPFMLKSDGLNHRGPIMANRDAIGLAIAATEYGSRFFQNGGVPPFVVQGAFQSPSALQRASEDFEKAIKKSAKEARQALTLPAGLEVKQIGADPEKSQLVELQRFVIEQIARVYSLPPVFLQDLTHGTFSNTEQQDLHFVKHTIKRWVEQFEQEINLKLFGRGNNRQYVEFEMDGLLRGDFKTRMDGYAQAVNSAIMTPNEARAMENRPTMDGGDRLMIQGATVPINQQMNLPLQEPNNE